MKKIKGFDDYFINQNWKVYSIKTGELIELKPYLDSKKKYWLIIMV